MRLLLDSHVLIWWWSEKDRLSETVLGLLQDRRSDIVISGASGWEIATKQRIGKLALLDHFRPDLPASFLVEIEADGFDTLPVSLEHGLRAGSYALEHADPFDRLLAAQSEIEGMPLVTRDPAFAAFPCETLW